MLSDKQSIQHLVEICARKGLRHVVISPGSRNAPINISFHGHGGFECQTITDERVAAFIGLGMAMQTNKPAILICTSGTATLNYAAAIAEAYYQKIPMLILTADRPVELIDQGIGQTIRQYDVYHNYIKASYQLKEDIGDADVLLQNDRIINEAINQTMEWDKGPVHINIPLREPLYQVEQPVELSPVLVSTEHESNGKLKEPLSQVLIDVWNLSHKKLIIVGQSKRYTALNSVLNELSNRPDTILLSETTSHVKVDDFIQHIDRVIDSISPEKIGEFYPDLIISIGDAVVSKKIKVFLRNAKARYHWHIGETDRFPDTYGALSHKIKAHARTFLKSLSGLNTESKGFFSKPWLTLNKIIRDGHEAFMRDCPWSDMAVFGHIMPSLSPGAVLHLANSTPIRYTQLFDYRQDLDYCCNRGVGGIDGCTSTAVGSAMARPDLHVLITGDLSFFYDSNAFWIPNFPNNLKIIVINNGGGNIFRIIPGPSQTDIMEDVFEAHHDAKIKSIADAFGLKYKRIINFEELSHGFTSFLTDDHVQILEIVTPRFENDRVLKNYFSFLKKSIHQYA